MVLEEDKAIFNALLKLLMCTPRMVFSEHPANGIALDDLDGGHDVLARIVRKSHFSK